MIPGLRPNLVAKATTTATTTTTKDIEEYKIITAAFALPCVQRITLTHL